METSGLFSAFGVGGVHLQHLLQLRLDRFHRILLPPHGPRHRGPVERRGRRHHRLSRTLWQRLSAGKMAGQEPDLHRRRDRHAADPLPPFWYALEHRTDYGDTTVVYGARTSPTWCSPAICGGGPSWTACGLSAASSGGETPDWDGQIGFVPTVVEQSKIHGRERRGPGRRAAHHDPVHPAGARQDGAGRGPTFTPAWRTA